ncbi:putative methyltransferase-domain-containing protein [Abortiporus biennis]|nr:putative methyltransferase-domain-containing protein [Abortiporus biennis]
MPKQKSKRRKTPITSSQTTSHSGSSSSSNPASTRTVIRRFHVLIKRKSQLEKQLQSGFASNDSQVNTKTELASIEEEIEELGGLETYQRMSSIGQGNDRGGGSEKVFIEWLNEVGFSVTMKQEKRKAKLMEVGALKPDNYAPCSSWIENRPMDLHSRHPSIEEQDFLLLDQDTNFEQFDLISLSLVVNFVPEPKDRGRMLNLAWKFLRPDGYLFLALPLPCITNSRYMTPDHLHAIMSFLSFTQVYSRWKAGGKMAYWLFQKSSSTKAPHSQVPVAFEKKTVLRTGNRNNFSILL